MFPPKDHLRDKKPLANRSVLVTRPQHQATIFQKMLKAKGAEVYLFPTLEITPLPIAQQRPLLNTADIVIFTSPNAVTFSHSFFSSLSLTNCKVAAIGKKTTATLAEVNIATTLLPQIPFNSEALLKHPELQSIKQKKILIIKGQGGRDLLKKQLSNRGAGVKELAVYRRKCPTPTQYSLNKLKQKKIDIITLTSSESAYNLFTLLGGEDWLPHTPLLVGSSRIQKAMLAHGITNPLFVANNPSDETMLQTLLEWNSK